MTDDEQAVTRGADAGWALGLALKECLPDQSELAIKAAIAALVMLLASMPAEAACHRFSVWKYPWPQRCEATHRLKAGGVRPALARAEAPTPPAPDAQTEEEARARAIDRLRAALEAANAH